MCLHVKLKKRNAKDVKVMQCNLNKNSFLVTTDNSVFKTVK